ncbi:hypothetical protein CUJ83_07695 [Methanocella sp. CWC-04]|uniref:DUF2206 domain-containing protein n=1 Tax=Methanooceanicella nereidis TaxID=2052831 RepID=A0AAP2RCR3_9EURY|nr:DUF2206 domain-containing protein [Methanocella sp. CWC-04]MCD1294879.1 hypothetical protein [Methanocella sp. CWC-04]
MKAIDIFQAKYLKTQNYLWLVLAVQSAFLGVLGIGLLGYDLPVLRPLICLIYLAFIPGSLILRSLNVRNIGSVESLLYSVGLSLSVLMFTGLMLNMLGPLLSIQDPISLLPLAISISAIVFVLMTICVIRERNAVEIPVGESPRMGLRDLISPPALILFSLPLLAVFGTYLMNLYNVNLLILLLILLIASLVLMVGFDRIIPKKLFPLAILMISVTMLLHSSLISPYVVGWDIQQEKYLSDNVISSGYWNVDFYHVINSMLSVVMLAPIFSILMDVDIVWVFKVVYPLLFSLVPLGLYQVFKKQSNEKFAFFSAFFFISLVVFYTEMITLARQEIAELFLVLIVLLIINRDMDRVGWSAMFILFSFSLALSHYGLTYIFLGSLVIAWATLFILKHLPFKGIPRIDPDRSMPLTIVLAFVMFCFLWYVYTSMSNPFETIVFVGDKITGSLLTEFFNPESAEGLSMATSGGNISPLHRIYLYLFLASQLCIFFGVITVNFKNNITRFTKEYFVFALIFLVILISAICVPYFSSALNTTRLYQISLIFLAPFFVLGWMNLLRIPYAVFTGKSVSKVLSGSFKLLSLFLAIYLLFNTGVIFEVLNDGPISLSLDTSIDGYIYDGRDVMAAEWLMGARNVTFFDRMTGDSAAFPIYGDHYRRILLMGWDIKRSFWIPDDPGDMNELSYLYLGSANVMNDRMVVYKMIDGSEVKAYIDLAGITDGRDRIYSNGGAQIYY